MTTRPLRQLDDEIELAAARRAFIDAALEIVSSNATLDVGVVDVVRRSGWHNAAFYRIFGSEDGRLLAGPEDAVGATAPDLRARPASAAPPVPRRRGTADPPHPRRPPRGPGGRRARRRGCGRRCGHRA